MTTDNFLSMQSAVIAHVHLYTKKDEDSDSYSIFFDVFPFRSSACQLFNKNSSFFDSLHNTTLETVLSQVPKSTRKTDRMLQVHPEWFDWDAKVDNQSHILNSWEACSKISKQSSPTVRSGLSVELDSISYETLRENSLQLIHRCTPPMASLLYTMLDVSNKLPDICTLFPLTFGPKESMYAPKNKNRQAVAHFLVGISTFPMVHCKTTNFYEKYSVKELQEVLGVGRGLPHELLEALYLNSEEDFFTAEDT